MSEEEKNIDECQCQECEKTKKELKQEKKEEKKALKQVEELEEELDELKKKLEDTKKQFETSEKEKDEWKNKYYQAYADLSNTRKQVEKEGQEFKKYANKSLISEIIPVLDSFDMAFKSEPQDEKVRNYLVGFKMIYAKLHEFLQRMNVEVISPKEGDEFDPHTMEALSTSDGEEDNKVIEVYYKGYKLHDSLLRAASVVISKKKQADTNKDEQTSDETEDLAK